MTRPRGYAPWSPRATTLLRLEAVLAVLDAFADYWPLSIRNVWYRLIGTTVAGEVVEKNDTTLGWAYDYLNRGRRAGLVQWEAITDAGFIRQDPDSFTGPADFWQYVADVASGYALDLQEGQPVRLAVWCEAAGLLPQVKRVAWPLGIPVLSGGGMDSLSGKREFAVECVNHLEKSGQATLVGHVGDLDKAGGTIFTVLAEDVPALAWDTGAVSFTRLAVTRGQVTEHRLPTDMKGNVQAEALPPDVLAGILTTFVDDHHDVELRPAVIRRSTEEQAAIAADLERLRRRQKGR